MLNLTGKWNCIQGGTYYIRQVNEEVWWLGEEKDSHPGYCNVAHGKASEKYVILSWSDVPKGQVMQSGILVLTYNPEDKDHNGKPTLHAMIRTGGFGGITWIKP
jgi:hypothetical protein